MGTIYKWVSNTTIIRVLYGQSSCNFASLSSYLQEA